MSHRFPPIAPQSATPSDPRPLDRSRSMNLQAAPSLPWFELALGLALLVVLRGI